MIRRIHITVRGAVQGVGFRPFIYRLATQLGLNGWVNNSPLGVFIEAEGEKEILDVLVRRIQNERPAPAIIESMEFSFLDAGGYHSFEIRESDSGGPKAAFIMPDIALCDKCLEELFDPKNRRYRYPLINCTHCGPRFSIIQSLPYDRPNTSMKTFDMCEACRKEYDDPSDRRFHAQPIACPECGPHIEAWDRNKHRLASHDEAITFIARAIRDGKIIALKGLGGYQLIGRADDEGTVSMLRQRKHREEKPFALMFPDMNSIKSVCDVSPLEERLLMSPESPIVLLQMKDTHGDRIYSGVAPGNPYLGVMRPYTPLHHLLMRELHFPIMATSGNLSEEPMAIDEESAISKLGGIADYFLIHNRPIVRHVDDSIVRVILGREMVMRRARGYAPLPIPLVSASGDSTPVLAVGGHLKNTVALAVGRHIFTSQHIGDLSTQEAYTAFTKVIDDLRRLYDVRDHATVCDLHPEYLSTKYATELDHEPIAVQHHEAHVAACRLENRLKGPALGVSWDGTGYGFDGTIWGGEFFLSDDHGSKHVGQFFPFPLPGGEKAVREPRRCALGVLFALYGERLFSDHAGYLSPFSDEEITWLRRMLSRNINCPVTSSAGRLFDAVASLIGIRQQTNYEGQSAMMLEFATDSAIEGTLDFDILDGDKLIFDWRPTIEEILTEMRRHVPAPVLAAKFHNTLAEAVLRIARMVGEEKVVLSGGCFQNAFLLERTVRRLESEHFKPYWHQRIPTNDGGIAVGQIAVAMQRSRTSSRMRDPRWFDFVV